MESTQRTLQPPRKTAKKGNRRKKAEFSTAGTSSPRGAPTRLHRTRSSTTKANKASSEPIDDDFLSDRLNDDCLLKVTSYLSFVDCIRLASTCEHFRRFFRENSHTRKTILITGGIIHRYPFRTMKSAYESVCRNLTSLRLVNIKGPAALDILSTCKQLKHLIGGPGLELLNSKAIRRLPKNLESLELLHTTINQGLWIEWCQQLGPSLQVLKIGSLTLRESQSKEAPASCKRREFKGLGEFKNLREFRFGAPKEPLPSNVHQLLLANRDTLEHLHLLTDFSSTKAPLMDLRNLNQLTDLTIPGFYRLRVSDTANIRNLRLVGCDENSLMSPSDLPHFANLEYLKFDYSLGLQPEEQLQRDVQSLIAMKNLRHLAFSYLDQEEDDILQLVVSLPQLKQLTLEGLLPRLLKSSLIDYLEDDPREFRVNNVLPDGSSRYIAGQASDSDDSDSSDDLNSEDNFGYDPYGFFGYDSDESNDSDSSSSASDDPCEWQ